MPFIIWLLIGGCIGAIAANRRGWSLAVGILAGALLGCASPLLLFVSGVSRSDAWKTCPKCAEKVKAAATLCRYCGSNL